jgi:Outer membrane protein beta-barrel domain
MNRISFVAALGLAAGVTAGPLPAQSIDGGAVHFGIMGGATRPVGDVAYLTHLDWNLGALVMFGAPSSHLNVRVDGQWQQLAGKEPIRGAYALCPGCNGPVGPFAQDYRVLDLTTNLVYNFAPLSRASFYLIGGVGVYYERQSDRGGSASEELTGFGVNGGAGVKFKLGRLQPFVEARYHTISGGHSFAYGDGIYQATNNFQFIPINVGIVF